MPADTATATPTRTGTAPPTTTALATASVTATPSATPTPGATIVLVQSGARAVKASSVAVTLGSNPIQGNLLVAIVGADNASTLTLSGWSVAVNASGENNSQAIFYKIAGASESRTVTANRTGNGAIGLQVFEYSGIATTNPLDQAATGTLEVSVSRANGTFTCGSVTTTQANELLIAGVSTKTNPPSSTNVNNAWDDSFTERHDLLDPGENVMIASAHRIVNAMGTYQTGSNLQGGIGSGRTVCQTATFRAAP
jgi:hypothetical protein